MSSPIENGKCCPYRELNGLPNKLTISRPASRTEARSARAAAKTRRGGGRGGTAERRPPTPNPSGRTGRSHISDSDSVITKVHRVAAPRLNPRDDVLARAEPPMRWRRRHLPRGGPHLGTE